MSRICKQEEALSDIQFLRNICYATFFILVLMISANMVSPSCSKFCQLKRKKNFAQSASDGTAGECSVMFDCKFPPRIVGSSSCVLRSLAIISRPMACAFQGFRRWLCCYVMSLGVTLRCRQKCQRPATPDGAASDFLKRRAGSVGATSGSPPPNATQPPLWWACLAFEPCLLTFLGQHVNQLLYSDDAI